MMQLELNLLRLRCELLEREGAAVDAAQRVLAKALLPWAKLSSGDVGTLLAAVLSTAAHGDTLQPGPVVAALASARLSLDCTLVHRTAAAGDVQRLLQLLAAAPETASVADDYGSLPLHTAARMYRPAAIEGLLSAAPEGSAAADRFGHLPLHHAAWGDGNNDHDQAACVQRLLAARPQAALVADGCLPLHAAACSCNPAAVQLVLDAAPAAITVPDGDGRLPLHHAAMAGDAAVVQLLCHSAPEASRAADNDGCLPLHVAASEGGLASVEALLAADPGAASVADSNGSLPLHLAIHSGIVDAAPALVAAAPEAAMVRDADGRLPLQLALQYWTRWSNKDCEAGAHTLLPHTGVHEAAAALAAAGGLVEVQPLFADLVAARALAAADWQLVPAPCASLAAALPAVLARSAAEAAQLVQRLPPADRERLHTAALCLARIIPASVCVHILPHVLA